MLNMFKSQDGAISMEPPTVPPTIGVRTTFGDGGDGTDTPPTALIGFDDLVDVCPDCKQVAYSCIAAARDESLLNTTDSEGFIPCVNALKQWIEPPARPVIRKSKLHLKAKQEGVTMLVGTLVALVLLGLVLGGGRFPLYWFFLFAVAALYFAGKAFWVHYKLAVSEDAAMERAYERRLDTWKERMTTYSHLFYCPNCATVHDCMTQRSTPWYEFLNLMVYPDRDPSEPRIEELR